MNTSTRTFRLSRISRGWLTAFTLPLALPAGCGCAIGLTATATQVNTTIVEP